ncbi:putative nucleic acid-binding protein, contains PIN domain [Candidatus Nitrososphaera evergladensis SR1]|uniref:Putative nucleic acid-binding protein, contains PIN domain n=2 Tax=Nitrososphaera TaxID=497726 RepID=A0A075MNF9_9ARCH|nr:putative nucleic acid-binding protein, contains PIN domain [Candidatus Nitrososphaera evergladensis SR1]
MLILYLEEKGAERVAELLTQVLEGKIKGYMSVVNLAELYYILARKSSKIAEEKERNLRSFGIRIVPVKGDPEDAAMWKEAALLKASPSLSLSLSLAYAFAAATAKVLSSTLVTGSDPEFERIKGIRTERVG